MTRIIDSDYEHGPTTNRKRTDIICYGIFVAVLIFSGVCFRNLNKRANLDEFVTPVDFYGNQCGKGEAANHPYLLLPSSGISLSGHSSLNPIKNSVCVSTCNGLEAGNDQILKCFPNPTYTQEECQKKFSGEEFTKFNLYIGKFCIRDGVKLNNNQLGLKEGGGYGNPSMKNDEFRNGMDQKNHEHEHAHFESHFRAIPAL